MFYISTFFSFLRHYPFRNILFVSITTLLLAFPFVEDYSIGYVENLLPTSKQGESFHALISSDINVARVGRKLRALPGILQVVSLSEREIESKVQKVLGAIDVSGELLANSMGVHSNGLKIIFKKSIDSKVQLLIRDYLKKLVGQGNVMLGAISPRTLALSWADDIQGVLSKWGSLVLFGVLLAAWLIIFLNWTTVFQSEIKMLQRFQRRKNIGLKVYILLVSALFMGVFLSGSLTMGKFNILYLAISGVVVVLSGLIFSPALRWQK